MSEQPSWRTLAAMLSDVANGSPADEQDRELMMWAITTNLIESREVKKACRTCGTPQHDYSFFRITSAGRMLVSAFTESAPPEREATTPDSGGEHGR